MKYIICINILVFYLILKKLNIINNVKLMKMVIFDVFKVCVFMIIEINNRKIMLEGK